MSPPQDPQLLLVVSSIEILCLKPWLVKDRFLNSTISALTGLAIVIVYGQADLNSLIS